MHSAQYKNLFVMATASFVLMYGFMYAMVDSYTNIYPNVNQLYMAGLMTALMVLIELFAMRSMYMNKKLNARIVVFSTLALIAFFILIRQQSFVSDEQFLKSMIPHHASAILMCEKAQIQDSDIKELCKNIIANQQSEILQMKEKLIKLGK